MKRKNFNMALVGLASMPLLAKEKKQTDRKGFKIPEGEGKKHGHIKLKGVNANVLDMKVSGDDSEGGMAIFEQISLTQGKGTPMHVHLLQDEVFIVREGEYKFQVGEEKFHLTKGDTIFMPKNVQHAWTQISEKGKMTVIFQPAGKMESFFTTMAALSTEPTAQEIAKIFADNEMKVIGPGLKVE